MEKSSCLAQHPEDLRKQSPGGRNALLMIDTVQDICRVGKEQLFCTAPGGFAEALLSGRNALLMIGTVQDICGTGIGE